MTLKRMGFVVMKIKFCSVENLVRITRKLKRVGLYVKV